MLFSESKIDKSFVMAMTRDERYRVIGEIVIELARRVRLRSVA
jgi:sensor c-di-GMP phosphodiesterase-like protein